MLLKNAVLALALALGMASANAQTIEVPSGTYKLDRTHSSMHWSLSHFGTSIYVARFTNFNATLELDSKNPVNSKLSAIVNTASLKTDFPFADKEDFDEQLRGADWFNTDKHPQATFTATALKITGDNTGTMSGDLTFLGVTKPVTFNLKLIGQAKKQMFDPGAAIGFQATTSFKRSEFGMTNLIDIGIGDDVELYIQVELHQVVEGSETKKDS